MPSEKLSDETTAEIMVRDRATCVYCLASKTNGAQVSVDHITARSWGGSEETANMVVACKPCNDAKGTMDAVAFAGMIDRYKAILPALARFGATTGAEILARVEAARRRPIDPSAVRRALDIIRANRR